MNSTILETEPLNSTYTNSYSAKAVTFNIRLLSTLVWSSTLLFGLYILAFYGLPFFQQNMESWNQTLNNLYHPNTVPATAGIGFHFIAGGIILLLGCIQLINGVRTTFPQFHRITGRIYVASALVTSVGGLIFVFTKGTIGGWVMDLGFGLYGSLMFLAALKTIQYARAKSFELHRAWALRLFALAIGSWLYRMEYGFWHLFTGSAGHTADFTGPFDYFMDFFFFIPNLIFVEIILRAKSLRLSSNINWFIAILLLVPSAFVVLGTYAFTKIYWGPAILSVFA